MSSMNGEGLQLQVTGYAGHVEEILQLRNANRENPQSAAYMDWRYSSTPGAPQPKIFWLREPNGRAVGMAAVIYRAYRAFGEVRYAGLVGDISLDASLRGRGLGRTLLEFMTEELARENPEGLSCVIPTDAAKKVLSGIGWKALDDLVSHVLLLNPEKKLQRALRIPLVAGVAAKAVGGLSGWLALRHRRPGYSLISLPATDAALEEFWRSLDTSRIVVGDRGTASLVWRYGNHPTRKFHLSAMQSQGSICGYVVYGFPDRDDECCIYDFLLGDGGDLGCLLGLLVGQLKQSGSVESVRIVVNGANSYRRQLSGLGFVSRGVSATFQLYGDLDARMQNASAWHLTQGDKDI